MGPLGPCTCASACISCLLRRLALLPDFSFLLWKVVRIIALTIRFVGKIKSDSRTRLSESMKRGLRKVFDFEH